MHWPERTRWNIKVQEQASVHQWSVHIKPNNTNVGRPQTSSFFFPTTNTGSVATSLWRDCVYSVSLPPAISTMPGRPSASDLFQYSDVAGQSWLRILGCVEPTPTSSWLEAMSDACSIPSRYSGRVKPPPSPSCSTFHCQRWSLCQSGVIKSERSLSILTMTGCHEASTSHVIKFVSLGLVQILLSGNSQYTGHLPPAARPETKVHIVQATTDTRSSWFNCKSSIAVSTAGVSASSLKVALHAILPPSAQILVCTRSWPTIARFI